MTPVPLIGEPCIYILNMFLLLVHCRTYGFIASNPCNNSLSSFLSHPIRFVRLYNVLTLFWLVTIRHENIWHLL